MNTNNNKNGAPGETPNKPGAILDDSQQLNSQSQPATKKRRNIKVLLIVVVIILATFAVLAVVFYAVMYIGLSGGIGGVWLDAQPAPSANNSSLNKTRQNVDSTAKAHLQSISGDIGAKEFVVSTIDTCKKGQHNFKVSDSYAYKCNHRVTKLYGLNGEIINNLTKLSSYLKSSEWKSEELGSIEEYIIEYQANLAANKELNPDDKNPYSITQTPADIKYSKDSFLLTVDFIDRNASKNNLFKIEALTTTNALYDNIVLQYDSIDVVKNAQTILQKYPYVLVLSVSNEYYNK